MNPLRVSATNYRTFERLDVELPSGTVAIVGENGAGKSSILNVVDVALFADRGELPALLTVGEEELMLELTFEHAGESYRVRRQYSARGRGKTVLDFERFSNLVETFAPGTAKWEPLTRETAVATQELICATLGLSRTTFRASSFLRQGDGAAFTEAQPRDRKAILAEILGLDLWDRLLDRARVDLRGCEDELVKTSALIAGCDELAATRPTVEQFLEQLRTKADQTSDALDNAEHELEQARAALTAAEVQAEKTRTAEAELTAATAVHEQAQADLAAAQRAAYTLEEKKIELADAAADADLVDELALRLDGLRQDTAAAQSALGARATLTAEADQRRLARDRMIQQAAQLYRDSAALTEKAQHLLAHIGESASCDRCGQTLGREAAQRAAQSYTDEAGAVEKKAAEVALAANAEAGTLAELEERAKQIAIPVVEDPTHTERQLAAARRAAEQRATLTEQVRQLTEAADRREELTDRMLATSEALDEKRRQLEQVKEQWVDEVALHSRMQRWRIAVEESRGLMEQRRAEIARGEHELERIAEAEQRLAEHHSLIQEVNGRVDVLKLAERAYGRDGIPALIVENAAIPQLELEANRILGELGGATAGCRLELRTQRALKTTDSLRETLDIIIVTSTGERAYETFSGGERTRLNLALRIALARLLAHRRGAESRLLAIDEPEFLDEAGVAALADVLQGLSGDFDRVLLVSHHPTLATSFDQSITVSKDGDRSRLGDPGLEAIAA